VTQIIAAALPPARRSRAMPAAALDLHVIWADRRKMERPDARTAARAWGRAPSEAIGLRRQWGRTIFIRMGERQTLDDTLFALADPTRRAILARLAAGKARVTDVAAPFPISLNSVSKHIRILERANLVRRRRRGREHLLALNPRPLDAAARWLEEQRALWKSRLDQLDKVLTEQQR
jgi:DNA-binding transcriptional ArsR family regulator